MAVLVLCLVLALSFATHSDAIYCVCNSQSEAVLQKNIDYACGNGADCTAIQSSGACYNPNTLRDHCNYAVNSYFQRKGQTQGSCDFSGSCTTSQTPPSGSSNSGCVYQANPSTGGTTPSTGGTGTGGNGSTGGTGTGGNGSTGGTGTGGNGSTGGTGTGGNGSTGGTGTGGTTPVSGGTTNPGLVPGTSVPPGSTGTGTGFGTGTGTNTGGIGLAPTGSGFDSAGSAKLGALSGGFCFVLVSLPLFLSSLMLARI